MKHVPKIIITLLLIPVTSSFSQIPAQTFADSLVVAALERTTHTVLYDGSYHRLAYPGGDVADNRGVCTDVIIRTYRVMGIDLQKEVHEDMLSNFQAYPQLWNLSRPDPNIDHRRVPNLQRYFERQGAELEVSTSGSAYQSGNLVTWMLPGNLPHIGIVSGKISNDGMRPLIIHNIGRGPQLEDALFDFKITGHYRLLR